MFLDTDGNDAETVVQRSQLRHRAMDRRAGGNTQPLPTRGETIRTNEIVGTRCVGLGILSRQLFAQQAASHQHDGDTGGEHGEAERGPTEEAERGEAVCVQDIFDDHVRCGGDQRHHAAGRRRHGQRHEHALAVQTRLVGNRQNHRDEHRHDCRRTHKRADPARQQHDQRDQPRLVTAARLQHGLAQAVRHPGIHQGFADDEDGGNQDHHRVAKARQRFLWREDTAQHQGQHDEDRHNIGAGASPGKQDDGAGQDAKGNRYAKGNRGQTTFFISVRLKTWSVPYFQF